MYLVVIGWLYVAVMMAAAEVSHPQGTVLGAVFTFLLYGVGPAALMAYLLGTPARRRARKAAERAEPPPTQTEHDATAAAPHSASGTQPDQR